MDHSILKFGNHCSGLSLCLKAMCPFIVLVAVPRETTTLQELGVFPIHKTFGGIGDAMHGLPDPPEDSGGLVAAVIEAHKMPPLPPLQHLGPCGSLGPPPPHQARLWLLSPFFSVLSLLLYS